jgi:hypothetical protein
MANGGTCGAVCAIEPACETRRPTAPSQANNCQHSTHRRRQTANQWMQSILFSRLDQTCLLQQPLTISTQNIHDRSQLIALFRDVRSAHTSHVISDRSFSIKINEHVVAMRCEKKLLRTETPELHIILCVCMRNAQNE